LRPSTITSTSTIIVVPPSQKHVDEVAIAAITREVVGASEPTMTQQMRAAHTARTREFRML
jgi:hypothetical protein